MTLSGSSAIRAMGLARLAVGTSALAVPGFAARTIGFPDAHDNATARVMGRFFGVRDVLLGILLVRAARIGGEDADRTLALNAAVDGGDLVTLAIPLIRRQGIDRAAVLSALFALPGPAAWLHAGARIPGR